MWTKINEKWVVRVLLSYQESAVKQIIPDLKLRVANRSSGVARCLGLVHEDGRISFWSQDTWQFAYSFSLNSPSKKVVFESSHRYLASVTQEGGVEVWKLKG